MAEKDKVHLLRDDNYSSFEMPNNIHVQEIIEMFQISNVQEGFSMEKLAKFKGVKGLAKTLKTDLKNGLRDDERISELRGLYGANIPVQKQLQSLCSLITQCLGDTMLQVLLVAAVLSIVVNSLSEEGGWKTGWMEGVTILFAVVLIISITAGNDYAKQKQFRQLQNKLDESKVEVMRNGAVQLIDSKEVVVGDLLLFRIGNIFTVDGLLVHGSEIKIDESSLTGESVEIGKSGENPFLLSGTKVVDGTGTMLVLTVGENTIQGQMIKLMQQENPPTPLQQKLESVAEDIGKLGTLVAILTFLALVVNYFVDCGLGKKEFVSMETLQAILNALMIGVTIIVVAVPEGLPLAVTITLAYSVNRMKNEQNLVKTLASCEIMGGANNICSDKTGTLTQNLMTVVALWAQDKVNQNSQLSQHAVKLLCEGICYNSEANPVKTNKGLQQIGNKTECALLQLADNFGYNYKHYRPSDRIAKVIPFNSSRKRMVTLVTQDARHFAFVKGASEQILARCTAYLAENDQPLPIDEAKLHELKTEVIEHFAKQSLRTIAIAYKEISDLAIEEDDLVQNLTLVAIAGIKDPIRSDVVEAIQQCNRSEITVRMVTGDNILTAQAIAKECGILDKNYHYEEGSFEVMSGQEFRETVGGLKEVDKLQKLRDPTKFQMVARDLKVLARATPEDKYLLVTGLIELENVVAVTGDGTNDAPALRKADVGFAMGISGSEVAREAADIILMDDNFSSIITACKWGRNIYDCIRKFIQFQLTVNVVALFMSVVGAAILTQSPLNAIQMLWVNLIMDTFASLALATEPPSVTVLNRAPYGRRENIVNAFMYRTILGQSVYQIIVLCFLLFGAQEVLDLETPQEYKDDSKYPDNVVQLSFFFQTFVLMQVFNSVTCRRLDSKHPFYNLFNNPMFWLIQLTTIAVQFLLMYFGGAYVKVVGLTWQQNLISLAFAAFGLVVGMLVKLIPLRVFARINVFRENQLDEKQMDQTVTSVLRRRSTVRMKSSIVSQPILSKQGSVVLKQQASIVIGDKN